MQCDVTRIICITNNVEKQGRELQKFLQRSYVMNLSDLWNAFKKVLAKIWRYRHQKASNLQSGNNELYFLYFFKSSRRLS